MTEATQASETRRRFLKTVPAAVGVAAVPGAALASNFTPNAVNQSVALPGNWTLAYADLPERIESDDESVLLGSSRFTFMNRIDSADTSLDAKGVTVRIEGMQGVHMSGFQQAEITMEHTAHCAGGDVQCSVWSSQMSKVENTSAGNEFYVPLKGKGLDFQISLKGDIQTSAGIAHFEDSQSFSFSSATQSSAHKLREGVYAIGLPFDRHSVAGKSCEAVKSGGHEVAGSSSAYLLFSVHRAA